MEREIRIHSRLSHENIIQLYAAFEDDSNVYMVQEYATGAHAVMLLSFMFKFFVSVCLEINASRHTAWISVVV